MCCIAATMRDEFGRVSPADDNIAIVPVRTIDAGGAAIAGREGAERYGE
jgi:hypothetical protein